MERRAAVFGDEAGRISRYVDILAERGIAWGLLGPREADRLWERHVLNSVAAASLFPEGSSVVDVGSGAGLPGVPLALLRPDLTVCLLDSLLRRTRFLEEVVSELNLGDRVSVQRGRAEEVKGSYAVVTCRAVAPLERLIGWCVPLLSPEGRLVALKGASAEREIDDAEVVLRRFGLVAKLHRMPVPETDESTWAVEVTRSG